MKRERLVRAHQRQADAGRARLGVQLCGNSRSPDAFYVRLVTRNESSGFANRETHYPWRTYLHPGSRRSPVLYAVRFPPFLARSNTQGSRALVTASRRSRGRRCLPTLRPRPSGQGDRWTPGRAHRKMTDPLATSVTLPIARSEDTGASPKYLQCAVGPTKSTISDLEVNLKRESLEHDRPARSRSGRSSIA